MAAKTRPATKKTTKPKKPIIQAHHIYYQKKDGFDWVVNVTKGEHKILTLLQWYTKKRLSLGFMKALGEFMAANYKRAKEL